MSALLRDPCCLLGLAAVATYALGWSMWTGSKALRRWWAARHAPQPLD